MLLAFDQGSSKTTVILVSNTGEIISAATTGGACYFFVGMEAAFHEIKQGVKNAAKSANLTHAEITCIYGGMAGANWQDEIDMLTKEAHERFNIENITIVNDCVPALRGGSDSPNSAVLCAGSQFNCAVLVNGEIKHVLNNYIHPNDQGGEAIGLRALQAVFDSQIGRREKTVLTEKLMEYYGYSQVDDLLIGRDRGKLKTSPKETVPIIIEAAWQNDKVALDVITEFSNSIAMYATAAIKKYGFSGSGCEIVLSGGVFKSGHPLFFDIISQEVHRVSSRAKVVNAKYEPVVGAALLGLSNMKLPQSTFDICKKSAELLGLTRE